MMVQNNLCAYEYIFAFCIDELEVIDSAFYFQVSKAQKSRKDLNPSRTKDAKGILLTPHSSMLHPFLYYF